MTGTGHSTKTVWVHVLAADIGGTKTLVGLVANRDGEPLIETQVRYESAAYSGVGEILQEFLETQSGGTRPRTATLGIAGSVFGNRCAMTNLPWIVNGTELATRLGLERVELINDLAAVVHGISSLEPRDVLVLQEGKRNSEGPIGVIGAGTGLGAAVGIPTVGGLRVVPTEAGHAGFAPRDETEFQLWRELRAQHGRVSVERVVSGPGLVAIYRAVVETGLIELAPVPGVLESPLTSHEPAREIGNRALTRSCTACQYAVDLFLGAYGAEAGDFALRTLPTGGLFIAGGIAARLAPLLKTGTFLEAFRNKGRMRSIMEATPITLIQATDIGLRGAAALACH